MKNESIKFNYAEAIDRERIVMNEKKQAKKTKKVHTSCDVRPFIDVDSFSMEYFSVFVYSSTAS